MPKTQDIKPPYKGLTQTADMCKAKLEIVINIFSV